MSSKMNNLITYVFGRITKLVNDYLICNIVSSLAKVKNKNDFYQRKYANK